MRRVPLAGRDKLFVLSRARDTEIHRESGTMSPSAARRIYIPRRISRLSMPFIFQPKINEREFLLFRKEIIGKIIIEIEKAKRKRTCTCFPASDRDISKYKRINRSIYERRSSRDETSKKKKKKRVHRRVSKRGGKGRGNVRQLYRSEKFPTILPSLNVPPLCSSKSTSKLTRFSFERASLSANSVAGVYATTDTDSRFVRDFVVRARIIGYLF